MDKFDVQNEIRFKKRVVEIKATKNTLLTKNKVDASTPGHPQPSSTIYFIFSCSQARKKV